MRLGAYALAGVLHMGAIGAIAVLPPEALDRFVDTGTRVELRFFTVSASDAESSLPLNAPLLADRLQAGSDTGSTDPDQSGSSGDTQAGETADDEIEPEPDSAEAPADLAEADEADELEAPAPPVSPTGVLPADPDARSATPRPAPSERTASAPPPGVISPDRPVDTIQPAGEATARIVTRAPTFAEIEARADMRLRVEDFQVGQVEGGVGAVITEVFCLSSGAANREAGDCGDEPNAAQAELALYHIRALSRGPLEFAENMSRLEFELAQLGASPSTLELLRTHFLNAQREQIRRSPMLRTMERDGAARTDHLGVGAPITPQRARDPSGER